MHSSVLEKEGMRAQQLLSSSGECISMYVTPDILACSAVAFSTQTFQQDLQHYQAKVCVDVMAAVCKLCLPLMPEYMAMRCSAGQH